MAGTFLHTLARRRKNLDYDNVIKQAEELLGKESNTRRKQVRNFHYYQDLRRKNKTKYYTSAVQREMMRDRMTLGAAAFYKKGSSDD